MPGKSRTLTELVAGETFSVSFHQCDVTALTVTVNGPSKASIVAAVLPNTTHWTATADSTAWLPGSYQFEAFATMADGSSRVIERAPFTVLASLSTQAAGTDLRSVAEKTVEALEGMISGNASQFVLSYKINNRELRNYPVPELIAMLSYWRARAVADRRKARKLSPIGPDIRVYI